MDGKINYWDIAHFTSLLPLLSSVDDAVKPGEENLRLVSSLIGRKLLPRQKGKDTSAKFEARKLHESKQKQSYDIRIGF